MLLVRGLFGEAFREAQQAQALWPIVFALILVVAAFISVLASLTACVVFLMWIHRASRNLVDAGLKGTEFSPRWAVGWFFVPLANIIMPYQVMREIWMGSAFLARPLEGMNWNRGAASPLITWWWGAFLLRGVFGYITLFFDDTDLLIPSCLVTLMAVGVTLALVNRVSGMQEQGRSLREAAAAEASETVEVTAP